MGYVATTRNETELGTGSSLHPCCEVQPPMQQQQDLQARPPHRRVKGRRARRAFHRLFLLSTAVFLTASAAFSFPPLANGYADSLFGYVTILDTPDLASALRS